MTLSNEQFRRLVERRAAAGPEQGPDRSWCADEVHIDFPSIPAAVDRIRAGFTGEEPEPLAAEITLSRREADEGATVPLHESAELVVAQAHRVKPSYDRGPLRALSRQRPDATIRAGIDHDIQPAEAGVPVVRRAHAPQGFRTR